MHTRLAETIPSVVKGELASRDIQRGDFAAKLGVSHDWLRRRLSGEVDMTFRDFDRIVDRLGVDPFDMIARAQITCAHQAA